MSQQGERPATEDEWWNRLYDDTAVSAADTSSTAGAGDTLDDRFDSAADAVAAEGGGELPGQRVAQAPEGRADVAGRPGDLGQGRPRAWWETHPAIVPALRGRHRAAWEPPPAAPEQPDQAVTAAPDAVPQGAAPEAAHPVRPTAARPALGYVGDRPPTYEAEPITLPPAHPQELDDLVADTVLDGARYGTYTLRAASTRGDSARYRGEPRRDFLLTARFGSGETGLVLVAVASGARAAEGAQQAAAEACRWIGGAVGRSHARLAEDIRAGRRGDLKSGLHRLADRSFGKLRARAAELGLEPGEYTVSLRCLLLSADPKCRTRVFFGVGGGGLFRLRDGAWQDIDPRVPAPEAVTGAPVVGFGSAPPEAPGETPGETAEQTPEQTPEGDRLTMDLAITTPPSPYIEAPPPPPPEPFRFRASVARPGDTLLLCSRGLADPLRGEPSLAKELAERWAGDEPPGLAAFLADTQLRVKGYADDRTAVAVWES
ncbi:protein phosphatase 2C domain-containing protein [Streptomyces sp. NPDC052236]|uniref:protein phosphatase 2C domain-containing protein n=1 Tax=Streptomyces sp. NPDC052236 TaxID=3365686 RepID=UPI0037D83228